MSKPSISRLTGSRKKERRGIHPAAMNQIIWLDAMNDHCWRLDTLSELLKVCGMALSPEVAASAGHLIKQEVKALKALLTAARKKMR